MTAVEKYLFMPLFAPRSAWAVARWWESRRPLYNLLVGSAGLLTLSTAVFFEPGPPLMFAGFALVYGLMANLCYSTGVVADLLLRHLLGPRGISVGPVLFRYGLAVSLTLTLLPIPFILVSQVIQALFS